MIATPLAAAPHPATEEEAFLELVLSDPELLDAQFAAITAEDGTGQQPPEDPLAVKDVAGPGGCAVLPVSTSGARLSARADGSTTRRRNRQRSPPAPRSRRGRRSLMKGR